MYFRKSTIEEMHGSRYRVRPRYFHPIGHKRRNNNTEAGLTRLIVCRNMGLNSNNVLYIYIYNELSSSALLSADSTGPPT